MPPSTQPAPLPGAPSEPGSPRREALTRIGRQLRRYGMFAGGSALGAGVDYAVTLAATRLLGLAPELALGLAMLISATIVFFWHEHVTFGAAGQPGLRRRYLRFMAWSGLVFGLRAAILRGLIVLGLPLSLALAVAIGVVSVINYLISSRAIFAPKS